ncbi:right-handed parallel beta-helix repeat-containing protein [Demequina aurantiaca]|uniref:right-handed parallel beta-helix repeat-containing protein n=1 Tax=Demequina aurantiaca TaxID=676200 RepID=UPI003D328697
MVSTFHVSPAGSDQADGSSAAPWRTINRAASAATAGDTIEVHAGEYREWVKPVRGGLSDSRRITYTAAPGEHVVIKGSEVVTGWEDTGRGVWRARVSQDVFGDFNPFAVRVDGDWIVYPSADAPWRHLGDVYLNGTSLYEAASLEEVEAALAQTHHVDGWSGIEVPVAHPEQTALQWYAEVGVEETVIWANFGAADPNTELIEINVRPAVFTPVEHHLDYITVRGFEMAQAASPWAPPTANQPGLLGPNWAKGWIIEDNVIHDAKCVAISLGKEASSGQNFFTDRGDKPGYQYQIETVFSALNNGWTRENIGSHVVRGNTIYDCGQAGIVGHLGCIFSTITDNHIYRIGVKREFFGHEIAGIKLHAAIDVVIEHNRIHDCTLGIWLDWQTQGMRITRNLLYRNTRDFFIEVSHGPHVVDHNIFGSPASLEVVSQGGAYVNNLIAGAVRIESVMERATPYHVPHSTQVAGFAPVAGGDDRFLANLFLAGDMADAYIAGGDHAQHSGFGTAGYDEFPASMADFMAGLDLSRGDHERYHALLRPVTIDENAYAQGATAYQHEASKVMLDGTGTCGFEVIEREDGVYLHLELPAAFDEAKTSVKSGADLGAAYYPDAEFEDPHGRPVVLDLDLVGSRKHAGEAYAVGPLAGLKQGASDIKIW